MKNVKELKARIAEFEIPEYHVKGFVCIGRGKLENHLCTHYGMAPTDIWTYPRTSDKHNLTSYWYGSIGSDLYYVKESFAKKNNLMKNDYSLDKELADAKNKVEKLNSKKYVCTSNPKLKFKWSYQIVDYAKSSCQVGSYMKHHNLDYCVVMECNGLHYLPEEVTIEKIPTCQEVKLNDNYTAKVFKDRIEVGCQKFPLSILDELITAKNKITK